MSSFSVGILYSSQRLLKLVNENLMTTHQVLDQFKKIYVAGTTYVIDTCKACGWLEVNSSGYLQITSKGQDVLNAQSSNEMLRVQLRHYIYNIKPVWSRVLHYGRTEAIQYFPKEIKQCFEEAELLNNLDDSTIQWWDTIGAFARKGIEDKKISIGRTGEKLSIQYEESRVGCTPIWISLESNFAGFDILSKVSGTDTSSLSIEVKASVSNADKIIFFISENEWKVASLTQNYIFHIWSLSEEPVLYILTPEIIKTSIPMNQGNGTWENVRLEYVKKELEPYRKK